MANLALGFGELLLGGVLVAAAITGASLADVAQGKANTPKDLGSTDTGDGESGAPPATAGGASSSGYVNPFTGGHPVIGRTDQGVDVSLSPGDPIRAIGNARIIGVTQNWFQGQPFLWYQLLDGPHAGKYVYVAEQITPQVAPGQTVNAGDVIATYAQHGTALETGWATSQGATLARATTGYVEGQATTAGQDFLNFLKLL